MDDNTKIINPTEGSEPTSVQQTTPGQPAAPPNPAKDPKKSNKSKLLILVLVLMLLAGGGAYYWFMLKPKPAKEANQQTNSTNQKAETKIYFQFGTKVYAFDTQTKTNQVLTDKIPERAPVADVYEDSETWRLYYQQYGDHLDPDNYIALLEKDKEPVKIADNSYQPAANAKEKVVAYTLMGNLLSPNASKDEKNHTYIARGTDSKEVFVSDATWSGRDVNSPKSPYYTARGISPDTKKILFGLHTCFECDGPHLAAAFELDIETGATQFISKSTEPGYTSYSLTGEGFIINENSENALGFGPTDEPYRQTIKSLKSVGGSEEVLLTINEQTWEVPRLNQMVSLIAVEKRAQTYQEDGASDFDGFYTREGNTVSSLKKLSVSGFDGKALRVQQISEETGNCFGILSSERDYSGSRNTYEFGALCLDAGNSGQATYSKVISGEESESSYHKLLNQ